MNRTLLQRIVTGLLPFIVAACAMVGWAQSASAGEDGSARLARAEAMFAERCKKSGEFIHRTAQNVEGVFLMKIRPKEINYGDQFKMDDPYGRDFGGDAYIRSFLRGFFEVNYKRPETPRTASGIAIQDESISRHCATSGMANGCVNSLLTRFPRPAR